MRSNLKRDFRKIFIISGDSIFRKSVSNREKEIINLVKLVCISNGNFELIINKIENLVETQEHSYYNLNKIPELFNGPKTKDVSLLEFHSFAKQLHYYCNFYDKFLALRKKRTDKDRANKSLFD
jgi:hypothetical protein